MHKYFQRDYFTFGGKPVFIFGGEFNYTRCFAADWRDRMLKMRAAGLNAVNMYATWGYHERSEGQWGPVQPRPFPHRGLQPRRQLVVFVSQTVRMGVAVTFSFLHG